MNASKNKRNVKLGSEISFQRKNIQMEGIVTSIRENSVMVILAEQYTRILDITNNVTIVNHKNYEILNL